MNSIIGRSGIGAVALCSVLLVGCDSIRDVRSETFIPVPAQQQVLSGKVIGLGTARPVALSYNGAQNCLAPDSENPSLFVPSDCKFYGTQGQIESGFSFGSFPEGTAYNIVVAAQPYGKICTVANASGTVGSGGAAPVVTCEPDPAVARYDLTVNIAAAVQTLSNLKVSVSTEEGVQERDATGQTQVSFPGVLLNSGTNLPAFAYKVTATTDTTADGATTANLCTFTPVTTVGTNTITEGGENKLVPAASQEFTVVPSGPAAVTVNACSFAVSAAVIYNAAPGGTAQSMPSGGMTLALRNHVSGVDVQTLEVNAFSATPVSFVPVMANAKAIYELVVTRHPAGHHCVVAGTTVTNADTTAAVAVSGSVNINAPTAGAVLLVNPANTDWWAFANRAVRCRAIPATENQLTGTYQMDRRVADTTYPNPGRGREFLTFFEDGTFLYGINFNAASLTNTFPNATFPAATALRGNAFASSGVTHGFYAYDRTAGTISFTVFTATNINAQGRGLTGMRAATNIPTPAAPVAVTATGVQQGAGQLSMTFSWTPTGATTPTTRLWTMSEPEQIPGELTGTWITADHRRMFAYHGGETFAFHIGVNGLGNLQDICMLPTDNSTQSVGIMTKHAGSASNESFQYTCTPGAANLPVSIFATYNTRTPDLPHYAPKNSAPSTLSGPTTPRIVPGFIGRFPGTASQLDNRPTSPVQFQVTPGIPDTLVVQNTLNGVPIEQPVTFYRTRTN